MQQPAFEPFLLLGLLVNYNKFEFRNPYRLRLEDFVNETTIQKIVRGLGRICSQSRNHYVTPQEDVNEGWTLSNALAYIGLGILAPRKTVSTAAGHEDAKEQFAALYVLNNRLECNSYQKTDPSPMPPSSWGLTTSRMPTNSFASASSPAYPNPKPKNPPSPPSCLVRPISSITPIAPPAPPFTPSSIYQPYASPSKTLCFANICATPIPPSPSVSAVRSPPFSPPPQNPARRRHRSSIS